MHTLGVLLFIVAAIQTFGALTVIANSTKTGPTIAVTTVNVFGMVVEVMSAKTLMGL